MRLTTLLAPAVLAAAWLSTPAFAQPALNTVPDKVPSGVYQIEPTHTRVLFAVSHMGFTTWYGEFTDVSGTMTLNPAHVGASRLSISIPTATVSTSNTELDGELKSPAWFDAEKYPTIIFTSTHIVRTGHNTAEVVGKLSFHGVTRPETLDVTFNASGINPLTKQYTVGFNATGAVKRSDFKQDTYVPLIGDDVSLTISAAFVK